MNNLEAEQPTQSLAIGVGARSETGQREQNQDYMTGFSSPFGAVYLIADGMGGHRGGAEASRLVGEAFSRHLLATPASAPAPDALTLAVRLANIEVLEKSKSGNSDLQGMGSTVVIALVSKNGDGLELTTAHVGDSRIYLQRDGALTLLTKDHTQIQWLIDTKALDEAAARNHPDAGVLTRAMGHTVELEVDISHPIPLQGGDGILLCSDGLSGFVDDAEIRQSIEGNPDPTTCAQQLVELALASGSSDNITVQFLRVGEVVGSPPIAQRERSRQTLAEEPFPPPPRPARSRLPAIILSVALVMVLAAATWWFHREWVRRHPIDNSQQMIAQLHQRIDHLQGAVTQLNNDTKQALADIDGDVVALKKRTPHPHNLKTLNQEFSGLRKNLADQVAAAGDLNKEVGREAAGLDKAKLQQLQADVTASEKACATQQQKLAQAIKKKKELES